MGKLALNNALDEVSEVKALPDYASQIRHDLKLQRFSRLTDGLYAPKNSDLYTNTGLPGNLMFDELPGLTLGRQESRHGVTFGKLGNLVTANCEEIVAVKQSSQPEHLLGEMATFQYLQDKTPFPTFRPVAFLSENNEGYLLTEFNPNIFVIGMFDWQHASQEQKQAIISEVSNGLGRLHANFLYHGDASVRNLALNNRNKFFVVDPELMLSGRDIVGKINQSSLTDNVNDSLIGQLARPMIVDISAYYKSLIPRAYKKNTIKTSQQILDFLKANILPAYKKGLQTADIDNIRLINELYQIIEETIIQRAEQEIL